MSQSRSLRTIHQRATLTTNRSNTLECPTRLSIRSASPREVSKETSAADEEVSQEAITVDGAVTVDEVVVVAEAVDEGEVNKIAAMPLTIPSTHGHKWLCIAPPQRNARYLIKGTRPSDVVPTFGLSLMGPYPRREWTTTHINKIKEGDRRA